jgi:hypothetical protein
MFWAGLVIGCSMGIIIMAIFSVGSRGDNNGDN